MNSSSKRKRKGKFEWNEISSVSEDEDTQEEEESEDSLTVHKACYRKLRLLTISPDDICIVIQDADPEERDTGHDLGR